MPPAGGMFDPKVNELVIVTEDCAEAATGQHGGIGWRY
jgi:hypothetical protein